MYTSPRDALIPDFLSGGALEDLDQRAGQIEGEITPDEELDKQERFALEGR